MTDQCTEDTKGLLDDIRDHRASVTARETGCHVSHVSHVSLVRSRIVVGFGSASSRASDTQRTAVAHSASNLSISIIIHTFRTM